MSKILSAEECAVIAHRQAASGPGPWHYNGDNGKAFTVVQGPHRFSVCSVHGPGPTVRQGYSYDSRGEFIAHSWQDMQDLLATVAQLREENALLAWLKSSTASQRGADE